MSNEQWKKKIRRYLRHDSFAIYHAEDAKAQSTQREEGKKEIFLSHNASISH
jgi:hypothetical protein